MENSINPKSFKDYEYCFSFSCIWAFAGCLIRDHRKIFDSWWREIFSENQLFPDSGTVSLSFQILSIWSWSYLTIYLKLILLTYLYLSGTVLYLSKTVLYLPENVLVCVVCTTKKKLYFKINFHFCKLFLFMRKHFHYFTCKKTFWKIIQLLKNNY